MTVDLFGRTSRPTFRGQTFFRRRFPAGLSQPIFTAVPLTDTIIMPLFSPRTS